MKCSKGTALYNGLFLEQAKGYVRRLEKSTSPTSTMREVFELCAQNDEAGDEVVNLAGHEP